LYCSGQIPIDPETGLIVYGDIKSQTIQVIKNIDNVLKSGGSGFSHIIKTVCYLKNIQDFDAFNMVYAKHFISKPARSCVEVSALPKGALVEIEVTAMVIK
jgi:2-iminobutanoate/2-iminopropanoate deaminase